MSATQKRTALDLTKVNLALRKRKQAELLNTARHEAGHAVIAKLCGAAVKEVAMYVPGDKEWKQQGWRGAVQHEHVWDTFKKLMVRTSGLAGELIDEELPRPFSLQVLPTDDHKYAPGTQGDAENIDDDIYEKFIGPGSVQVHPDFHKVKWINEAYYVSHQLLRQFRPVFDELVAALLEKKKLSHDEALVILQKLPRKAPRSKLFTWATTQKAIKELEDTNPNDPRLALYYATKRAMDIQSEHWKTSQAFAEAKKVYDESRAASDRAQEEIQYMVRNGKTLLETKQHFLGNLERLLVSNQEALKREGALPWQQRSYQNVNNLRESIKKLKGFIATHKQEIKALKAQKVAA